MRDSNPRLTLVIPSFLESLCSLKPVPRLATLELLLARSNRFEYPIGSHERRLFALFGYELDGELPIGAVRRIGDGSGADEDWWYCAAPVHFLADRDRVHVIGTSELAIRPEEAATLAQLFNTHFSEEGWRIEMAQSGRWYLRAPGPQAVRTVPFAEAISQDLRSVLPTGADALRWHRFLNEIQMLFHGSEVNRIREQEGLPTINGLWLWGGGVVPALTQRFVHVWSDEPLARGLAKISGSSSDPIPEAPSLALRGDALAFITAEADPLWWNATERRWFAPMGDALKAGTLNELVIDGLSGAHYCVSNSGLRRWWRRRRTVCSYL